MQSMKSNILLVYISYTAYMYRNVEPHRDCEVVQEICGFYIENYRNAVLSTNISRIGRISDSAMVIPPKQL